MVSAKRLPVLILVVSMLVGVLPAVGGVSAEEPKTLVVGLDFSESTSMDPHQHFEVGGALTNFTSYEPLVRISADDWHTPQPVLAESWDVSDDGLTYTFHLNPDAKFASGNPVTAEDVRFSWMRLKNKQGLPAWFMGWVEDVEVVDDHTVKAVLYEPSPGFLMVATTTFLGIMDSELVKEHGGTDSPDAVTEDTASAWLDQNSAGSGPFILKKWDRKNEILLEANPNYWGEPPKVDRIVIKMVTDPTTALQMMQRGDMDVLLRLDPDLVDQAEADPNLTVELLPAMDLTAMIMTCDPEWSEPLSDPRVRQAIDLAIDRDGLIEGVLRGLGRTPPSIIPIGMEGVDPEMTKKRDLDKARELLKEAGYEDGFTETLAYPVSALWDLVAAKVQSDLAEVGITVELNPMDFSLLLTQAWEERTLPWFIDTWIPDYVDYTIWTEYWGHSDHDYAWIARCELPEELEEASNVIAHELDPEKRQQAVKDWQEQMMDFVYSTVLYQSDDIAVLNKDVEGFGYIPVVYTDWGKISK